MPTWDQSGAADISFLKLDGAFLSEKKPSVRDQVRQLFEEHRDRIYRYLCALGASPADGEELTQETYLRLFQLLRDGGKVDNHRAWLFRVAHNLWRDEGRNRIRRPKASMNSDELVDPQPNPESLLADRQRQIRLRTAIDQLTELERSALYLRSEGLSYREASDVLGVSISTIAAAVRRAVEKIGRLANG